MPSLTIPDPTRLETGGISNSIAEAIAPVAPAGPIAAGSLQAIQQAQQGFQFGESLGRLPVRNAAAQDAMERFKFEGALRPLAQQTEEARLRELQAQLQSMPQLRKNAAEERAYLLAQREVRPIANQKISEIGSYIGKEPELRARLEAEDAAKEAELQGGAVGKLSLGSGETLSDSDLQKIPELQAADAASLPTRQKALADLKAAREEKINRLTKIPSYQDLNRVEAETGYAFTPAERKEYQDSIEAAARITATKAAAEAKKKELRLPLGSREDAPGGGYYLGKGPDLAPIFVPPAAFTEQDSQQINAVENAKGDLDRAKIEYAEYAKSNKTNPTSAAIDKFSELITGQSDASALKAANEALLPNLARGVFGEKGVLTDTDIARYRKTLPDNASPAVKADALFALLDDKFRRQTITLARTMKSTLKPYGSVLTQFGLTEEDLKKAPEVGTKSVVGQGTPKAPNADAVARLKQWADAAVTQGADPDKIRERLDAEILKLSK